MSILIQPQTRGELYQDMASLKPRSGLARGSRHRTLRRPQNSSFTRPGLGQSRSRRSNPAPDRSDSRFSPQFFSESPLREKRRNEMADKSLKTINSAKSLIRRSQGF